MSRIESAKHAPVRFLPRVVSGRASLFRGEGRRPDCANRQVACPNPWQIVVLLVLAFRALGFLAWLAGAGVLLIGWRVTGAAHPVLLAPA